MYLGHHGHDLPCAELEGVLLSAGEVCQHPGVLKLARPRLDNELAHQVPDQSEGVKILLTNERRVLPDGGRLGCADHHSAPGLERDLEAVGLDGAHLTNVLKTEEFHNLQSVITKSIYVFMGFKSY